MSTNDRRPYLTSTTLDQTFLNNCADNLVCQLELVVEIQTPDGVINASDRNKYVGETFYEALLKFPTINRTVGDWLSNVLEFSVLELELSNADGRFNKYVPGGASFDGWIGKSVEVKLGLRDVASTYRTVFRGKVTEVGGFSRSVRSVTVIARDVYDQLTVSIPPSVFTRDAYPDMEDGIEGLGIPVIRGNWTTDLTDPAVVPAFVVNGANANVIGGTRNNVQCVVTEQPLDSFDSTKVYLVRASNFFLLAAADIVSVGVDDNNFQVKQNGASSIDGVPYEFESGDQFYCHVTSGNDNIVTQAAWLLEQFGGLTSGDFDSNWTTYTTALSSIKSRLWIQEGQSLMEYVLSMFEQVRLEAFISIDQKIRISSLRFEDLDPSPSFTIKNWDVERESFQPQIDDRNNFNRAQAAYNLEPSSGEETRRTSIYKNAAAIAQVGKAISKQIVFPNLYVEAQVTTELTNILKLASAYSEQVTLSVTWRSLLLELGDMVFLNVAIGASVFENVPCLVRAIGYDPNGLKINLTLWSFQMTPYAGYTPTYSGIVGGSTATITVE